VPKFDIYGWIECIPLRGIRRTTARRMIESQETAAAVTSMDYADLTELVALREKEKKAAMESRGIKLTYMPFIIRAVVEALKMHPYLNSTLDEDEEEIILKKYYNISIAVATEEGLIVLVIKGADQKSILELAEEIARMVEQASSRKIDLSPFSTICSPFDEEAAPAFASFLPCFLRGEVAWTDKPEIPLEITSGDAAGAVP